MSARTDAYHWLRPDVAEGPLVRVPASLAAIDLRRGTLIACELATPLIFTLDDATTSMPHWIGDRVPLVSELFVSTLRRAGVYNFQTLPAVLRPWTGHVVFNVISKIDGADPEASIGTVIMEEDPGPKLVEYTELVLSHSRTRGIDMFRLADNPGMLLVHDRVMRVLSAHAPDTGWGFTAIEIELRS